MTVKVFCCYAREDKHLVNKLKEHLKPLQREKIIDIFDDNSIIPGSDVNEEISQHLANTDIILLFISPSFMASDECNEQFSSALKRAGNDHDVGWMIPILLRPFDWKATELRASSMLPSNLKPVTSWSNRDEAFHNIALEVKYRVIDARIKQFTNKGDDLQKTSSYEEALSMYEQAIKLAKLENREYAEEGELRHISSYFGKGETLYYLNRFQEALEVYEQILKDHPDSPEAHTWKGNVLCRLNRYTEAIIAYDEACDIFPDIETYVGKAKALELLERSQEARSQHAEVLFLSRSADPFKKFYMKSTALLGLGCYEEARISCEKAIQIKPDYAPIYNCKGAILYALDELEEAVEAYNTAILLNRYYVHPVNNIGVIYSYNDKMDEALIYFHKALELDPHFIYTYIARAQTSKKVKSYNQALNDLLYVYKYLPENLAIVGNIIDTYKAIGKNEEAKSYELIYYSLLT